jgi:hypothetical protein
VKKMVSEKDMPKKVGLLAVVIMLLVLFAGSVGNGYAVPSADLDGVGYLDFAYGNVVTAAPTGEKPESKLWWHDGSWWGVLWNLSANTYRIYQLDSDTQTWHDTGVGVDSRPDSKADVLWDPAADKLYVASHHYTEFSKKVADSALWARLYRYSYNQASQSYALDPGFPVNVNGDQSETLVLDKDSTGRLWVAYPSRESGSAPYQVYVNATTGAGNDAAWGTPFSLASMFPQAGIAPDDIASLVAFSDNQGHKIGVMWTNQLTHAVHFASRQDSNADPAAGWTLSSIPMGSVSIDDHVSVKSLATNSAGQVFGVVKTSALNADQPLILAIARDKDGSFSSHTYSLKAANDTRPILVIHEGDLADPTDDRLFVFVSDKDNGDRICYKTLNITVPLSAMGDFPAGNCGTPFIEDTTYDKVDNATSSKHNATDASGIVVLASDDVNGQVYVHNIIEGAARASLNYIPLITK